MRPPILLLVSLLAPVDPAYAQVTVDLHALDALPNARQTAPRTNGQRARERSQASTTRASAVQPNTATANAPQARTPKSSPVPESPPPPPTDTARTEASAAAPVPIAPPDATLPTGAPPAPPPPTLEANAAPSSPPAGAGTGAPVPVTAAAVRVNFTPAQTDLGPDETARIKQLVDGAPRGDTTTFNVVAYAAATPDDPSAARRLSLSRALAVRTALMADGVPSSRIYVRALGGQGGDGPADRADVSVLGSNASSSGSAR